MIRALLAAGAAAVLALPAGLAAQGTPAAGARQLPPQVRRYVSVDAPVVALVHARLIDGTGRAARDDQTVIVEGERIARVGPSASVAVPAGAQVVDLSGHTLMPGIVGMHNHMYYGGMQPMFGSYPRLFMAAGVTTIRTTGSVDSYGELNLKRMSEVGTAVSPTIVVTGPYLQGPTDWLRMTALDSPEAARRMVRYWAEEGVTWFKAYTTISRATLGAAIDEAHRHGVKVTAHLCSVGFREAVSLGIDNLEHGFLVNTEHYAGKKPDECPAAPDSLVYGGVDINGESVQRTIREMVARKVPLTSTLAVMELSSPSRIPNDPRVLDALHPDLRPNIETFFRTARERDDAGARAIFRKAMDFERAFVKAGGLLAAGSDPCCVTAIAGFADQRNFELLVEAGFPAEDAVRIMTLNGAMVLGMQERIGSVEPGKQADLVVLRGDPTKTAGDIRNVVTVFRRGVGYDSAKLLESVKGMVGYR
jgi:imidazolonepropionase-like amidohydrolase